MPPKTDPFATQLKNVVFGSPEEDQAGDYKNTRQRLREKRKMETREHFSTILGSQSSAETAVLAHRNNKQTLDVDGRPIMSNIVGGRWYEPRPASSSQVSQPARAVAKASTAESEVEAPQVEAVGQRVKVQAPPVSTQTAEYKDWHRLPYPTDDTNVPRQLIGSQFVKRPNSAKLSPSGVPVKNVGTEVTPDELYPSRRQAPWASDPKEPSRPCVEPLKPATPGQMGEPQIESRTLQTETDLKGSRWDEKLPTGATLPRAEPKLNLSEPPAIPRPETASKQRFQSRPLDTVKYLF